jgi:ATP-dependent DNA ligase
VVGFTLDDNDRINGLYLGRPDDGGLRYAGQVENGIGADDLAELDRLCENGASLARKRMVRASLGNAWSMSAFGCVSSPAKASHQVRG